jgi:4-amino-4-deoxy-L-arabinose transferase-like glycosyltransferase
MTTLRPFGLGDAVLFLAILVVATGARAGYLAFGCDYAHQPGPVQVQGEDPGQKALIASVKERNSFVSQAPFASTEEPTAHTAPAYPWLVGLLARLPVDLEPTVRWIQCGLGALTAGLYFLFARRAFRSSLVGSLAGLAAAVYPFWVVNTAELNDGVLATFLVAACLFLGAHAGQAGGIVPALLYGLALSGAALARAALLPFAFVGLLWFLLRCRTLSRGWLLALLAFLGFANGLAPWLVRNFQVFREPVPVVDSAYFHLWVGNNPAADGGPATEEMLRTAAPAAELQKVPRQTERYARLGTLVRQEVSEQPAVALRRRLQAGFDFLCGARWFQDGQLAVPTTETMPEWLARGYPVALEAVLLALLLLGLLGWRWTYGWRFDMMPATLAMIFVPLPYLLSHAEALSGPRLPLDGVLLTYAAFVLVALVPGQGRDLLPGPPGPVSV